LLGAVQFGSELGKDTADQHMAMFVSKPRIFGSRVDELVWEVAETNIEQ